MTPYVAVTLSASQAGKHQSFTVWRGEPWERLPAELIFCHFPFLACVTRMPKHNVIWCRCTNPKTGYISCYFCQLWQVSHFHQETDFMLIRVILGGCLGDRRVNLKWLEFNLFPLQTVGRDRKKSQLPPPPMWIATPRTSHCRAGNTFIKAATRVTMKERQIIQALISQDEAVHSIGFIFFFLHRQSPVHFSWSGLVHCGPWWEQW